MLYLNLDITFILIYFDHIRDIYNIRLLNKHTNLEFIYNHKHIYNSHKHIYKNYCIKLIYNYYKRFYNMIYTINFERNELEELLVYTLNNGTSKTVWYTHTSGYRDIRFLFELLYLGGTCKNTSKLNNLGKNFYDTIYKDLLKYMKYQDRHLIINKLSKKYICFSGKFKPYPKNNYSKEYEF